MPTVLRHKGYHVLVYTDDHPPPHVHVRKDMASVKVLLLKDGVKLASVKGKLSSSKVRHAGKICKDNLAQCWTVWRRYYG